MMVRLAHIILFLTAGLTLALAEPFPLELVNTQRSLHGDSEPALSADGRWLVYGVKDGPGTRVVSLPGGAQLRPSWFPFDAATSRLFVTGTDSLETYRVGPEGKGAIRPSFSPDGKRLAFYVEEGERTALYVARAPEWNAIPVGEFRIHPRKWTGDEPQWLNNQEVLVHTVVPEHDRWLKALARTPARSDGPTVYSTESKAAAGEASYWQRIDAGLPIVANIETGSVRNLPLDPASPLPTLCSLSPSGHTLAYLTVARVTAQGEVCDVVVGPSDGEGSWRVIRDVGIFSVLKWHPRSERLFLKTEQRIREVDLATAELVTISPPQPPRTPFYFTPGGECIVTLTDQGLAVIPLDGNPPRVMPSPERGRIAWVTDGSVGLKSPTAVHELELEAGRTKEIFQWDGVISQALREGENTVLGLESLKTPPDFFLLERDREITRLTTLEPGLSVLPDSRVESFRSPLEIDGKVTDVMTTVILPPNYDPASPPPAILRLYPGRLSASGANSFDGLEIIPAQFFSSRGYAVIETDTVISAPGQLTDHLEELVQVSELQLRGAAERKLIDPQRVAIMGHSHGGYSAMAVCAGSDLFRAGIATMGVYDLSTDFASAEGNEADYVQGRFRMGTDPWSDPVRYRSNSPFHRVRDIDVPVLLIAAGEDPTCPAWQSVVMWNALRYHGKDATLAVYPGEDHVPEFWTPEHRIDMLERVLLFLEKKL